MKDSQDEMMNYIGDMNILLSQRGLLDACLAIKTSSSPRQAFMKTMNFAQTVGGISLEQEEMINPRANSEKVSKEQKVAMHLQNIVIEEVDDPKIHQMMMPLQATVKTEKWTNPKKKVVKNKG